MSEGFKKIELDSFLDKSELKPKRRISFSIPKKVFIIPLLFLGLLTMLVIAVFYPARDLYASFQKVNQLGTETYAFAKNKDIEQTQVKLGQVKQELSNSQKIISRLAFVKYIPILGSYVNDLEHLISAATYGVEAGEIAIEAILPYTDILGLKGESSFVQGSAEERIQTAVETFDKLTPKLAQISEKMEKVKKELDQVDEDRYPSEVAGIKIHDRLVLAKDAFTQGSKFFIEARPLLEELASVFGAKEPKTYLVLFQNDAELRATGGFITAYALFSIDAGKMKVDRADDIYKLDESKRKKFPAPSPILKYHKDIATFHLRDSNLSPDFTVSMKKFESMLAESVPDFPHFDGIIAVDTHVLVSAIEILGDFNVYGRVFSTQIDKRCDCPKAIYELEDYATRPVAYVREARKDIIGVLLLQIMKKALGVSPSQYWGRLFEMFVAEANQKHVLFYLHNEKAQSGIEALNWAGRIASFNDDYLHINNVNFAGAKSNMFVETYVTGEINVANDGSIKKTVTIDYKNPAPPSNCNLEAGELCLNGILRNWLRVYVPEQSELIGFSGSEKETVSYNELGKTVFEGFLTVKPQGASKVTVSYKLPFKADGDTYNLLVQKQPGTGANWHTIKINGSEVSKKPLFEDEQFSFEL